MLRKNKINDITLVVGYLREQFEYLRDKYAIELLYNEHYKDASNNSSLFLARSRLDGAFVLDGDLLFSRDIFPQAMACSRRLGPDAGIFFSQPTRHGLEWEMLSNDDEEIEEGDISVVPVVAVNKWSPSGFGMVGCSFWQGRSAEALTAELLACEADYSWEDAAIRLIGKSPVYSARFASSFVRELDTLKETMDLNILSHEDIARLCSVRYTPVKLKGLTNSTWKIRAEGGTFYVLRVPGRGTERYIDRRDEPRVLSLLEGLDISPPTRFFKDGFKITEFLPEHRISEADDFNTEYFMSLACCLRKMHNIGHSSNYGLAPVAIVRQIELFEQQSGYVAPEPFHAYLLDRAAYFDQEPCVLCHRDLLLENIMVLNKRGDGLLLIDFEYAGFAHPLWDYASFILESGIEGAVRENFIQCCGIPEDQKDSLWDMEILQDYIWGLWGKVNHYQDYAFMRVKRALSRLCAVLNLDATSLDFMFP
jgi:CTP:phosphocholine cytidylyltransferase-like protein/thiamine kinase-like enzyme